MAVRRRLIALVTSMFLALGVLASTTSSSAAPPTGGISGTVTDTEGDPIAGAAVALFRYDAEGGDVFGVAQTTTAGDGTYSFAALADATSYLVRFSDAPRNLYASENYDDAYNLADDTEVAVTGGAVTTGIDAVLERAGSISGTLTGPDGPVELARVMAYVKVGTEWVYSGSYTNTDAAGAYTVGDLRSGTHRLEFLPSNPFGSPNTLIPEFYDNASSLETATDITLTEGQTVSGIDATLVAGGTIEGVITNRAGDPLLIITVSAYRLVNGSPVLAGRAVTDARGRYLISPLLAGSYVLKFSDETGPTHYSDVYWPQATSAGNAQRFTVTEGTSVSRSGRLLGVGKAAPRVKSSVKATFGKPKIAAQKPGSVLVEVFAPHVSPTGKVLVLDGRRVIQRVKVKVFRGDLQTIRVRRLSRGIHLLKVKYSGNAAITAAVSQTTRIRVR